ncbi:hypothetical protein P154DRAFT_553189, partial [Amniculicola lignicola CBS 123094]
MTSPHPSAPAGGARDVTPSGNGAGPATNSKMRKRTKTGCLTCRKRRIKCGEERPTCANCIKSKRGCEGYNQRVVFKTPIGDWPNHPGVALQYHNSLLPGSRPAQAGFRPLPASSQSQDTSLTSIQPRPLTQFEFSGSDNRPLPGLELISTQSVLVGGGSHNYSQPLHSPHHQQPLHSPHHQLPTPTSATSFFSAQPSPVHSNFPGQYAAEGTGNYPQQQRYSPVSQYPNSSVSYDAHIHHKPVASEPPHLPVSQASHEQMLYQHHQNVTHIHEPQPSYARRTEEYSTYPDQKPTLARYDSHPHVPISQAHSGAVDMSQAGSYASHPAVDHVNTSHSHSHSHYQTAQIPSHDAHAEVKYMPQHAVLEQPVAVSQAQQSFQPQLLLSGFGGDDHVSPTQILDEAAVEYQDDDYWDVQSDEDMADEEEVKDEDAMVLSRDFSLIKRIHNENYNELSIRRYDAFIYDGILTHYRAEQVANPLRNPKTARVFAHFIHITGPSLSIYERNPRNPASIFEAPIPRSQQSLWTYILPLKALNNQGLLHAMLALASLHIARLQGASDTPSYRHYAYALKHLQRYLANPRKRHQLPTLATSLLLAFYEVMTAEHVKWSTHLVGASHLLAELDFRSLTQEARRLKAAQTAEEEQFPYQNPGMLIDQKLLQQKIKESAMMPDEGLVSTIVGRQVNYDDFGRVVEEDNVRQERRRNQLGKIDLRGYETLQDLYWWYARQDAFQSIVSGNKLIMDYHKWSDCPPRAPLGRTDALHGSHDHIILLIGRIADFTVRDRRRKLKQMQADGGQWRPRPGMPGMPMGPPPPRAQGQGNQPPTPTTPMGPPPHMQSRGPPPGWTGPPPPGWTGAAPKMPQMSPTDSQGSAMGPPPGWTGPPPPGWPGASSQMPPPGAMPQMSPAEQPQKSPMGPPPGWTGPPPPGWAAGGPQMSPTEQPQNSPMGPPPGWTGPPPPGWSSGGPQMPPSGPQMAPTEQQSRSPMGPPPGWTGPPPPGWAAGGPQMSPTEQPQKSPMGPPPGWTGPPPPGWSPGGPQMSPSGPSPTSSMGPPPGWIGPPPPGWAGAAPKMPQMSPTDSQGSAMGPPPGWTGPPPPGWPNAPSPNTKPQMSPTGPQSDSPMGPPPGWTGPPPPGWTGPPPPGWTGPPPPGWTGPPPSQSQMPPPPPRGPPAMPTFYGMAPSRENALPSHYVNPAGEPDSPSDPGSPQSVSSDLPSAYTTALEEWTSISAAHATVAQQLANTPSFSPLTPDLYPTLPGGNTTPFGPALVHRAYNISILWTMLHLSQILLLRSHPSMPPAAMMAASICAPATAPYSTLIGRITAGMHIPSSASSPITPQLGAALIESSMSLFFAGVQYQDAAQREWTVTRLLEIDRRTGWASAGVIARSCETSWEKAAEMGRGPAYTRRTRRFGEEGSVVLDPTVDGETGGSSDVGAGAGGASRDDAGHGGGKGRGDVGPGGPGGMMGPGGSGGGWGGSNIIRDAAEGGLRMPRGGTGQTQGERARYEGDEKRFLMRWRGGLVPWAMNLLGMEEDLRAEMEG